MQREKRDKVFSICILLFCLILYVLPTGFPQQEDGYSRCRGKILEVDNQDIRVHGVVQIGVQGLSVEILDGPFRGEKISATNSLMGKLELDKLFQPGDHVLVVMKDRSSGAESANVIDYYRLDIELLLFCLFVLLLVWYARWTGAKAVLSFVFSILVLWKGVWPLFLHGWDPIITALLALCMIVGCVTFLVTGVSRTGLVAFLGTVCGAVGACLLALIFGRLFHVHGAVVPYAETLLHVGFSHIDLTRVFIAGIFLASSGAMMDVAVDIAVSMSELIQKKPDISRRELISSGFTIGRAVVGTMTTTLLLAYSGSFTALMMVFIAQGTPVINILNLTYIAAEILHTLVGSFGVVLVAPFTALLAGFLLQHQKA